MRDQLRPCGHTGSALVGAFLALVGGTGAVQAQSTPAAAPSTRTPAKHLYVVYFNPADRQPIAGYQERLDRIMTDVQSFYRDEMARNGYGPMTLALERGAQGRLVTHLVQSDRTYGKGQEIEVSEIDDQVKKALAANGIDFDREHVVIFQNLVWREGDKLSCWAPYNGGGDHVRGSARVTDNELVDVPNLTREDITVIEARGKEPLCNYVIAQMGGVAHELGHSLGLPHNQETADEFETLGYSLMGHGNYHYRRERTGKGRGSFLNKVDALILSSHPLFKGNNKDATVEPECTLEEVQFNYRKPHLVVSGRVKSSLPVYGMAVYHDPMLNCDYNSSSWVTKVGPDGHFAVYVGNLQSGAYELRLRCCHVNGAQVTFSYRYVVETAGEPPVEYLRRQLIYQQFVLPAFESRDEAALRAGVQKLEGRDDVWSHKGDLLLRWLTQSESAQRELSSLGEEVREVWLSSVKWETASVGYGEPARDCLKESPYVLESGKDVHATGLCAHAASRYVYRLGGKWKTFQSAYGRQNWVPATVVFVVRGDGKELFRSGLTRDYGEGWLSVDVSAVELLELIVEDGGNGQYADHANWLSPRLSR